MHRNTVLKLLVIAGQRCDKVMDRYIRNIPVQDVQCDEIWGYIYKKEGNKLPEEFNDDSIGDAWCWVAIERYTKLVLAFTVGCRTLDKAFELMLKLRRANAFSKKLENHRAAIALHFAYYNFCRQHGSLRVTPAMEAGITDLSGL